MSQAVVQQRAAQPGDQSVCSTCGCGQRVVVHEATLRTTCGSRAARQGGWMAVQQVETQELRDGAECQARNGNAGWSQRYDHNPGCSRTESSAGMHSRRVACRCRRSSSCKCLRQQPTSSCWCSQCCRAWCAPTVTPPVACGHVTFQGVPGARSEGRTTLFARYREHAAAQGSLSRHTSRIRAPQRLVACKAEQREKHERA